MIRHRYVPTIHADTCMKSLENLESVTGPSAIAVKVGARGEDDLIGDDGPLGGLGGLGGLIGGASDLIGGL